MWFEGYYHGLLALVMPLPEDCEALDLNWKAHQIARMEWNIPLRTDLEIRYVSMSFEK
jgi:hypothetical protein